MKIGFTADSHLRAGNEYPERYNALVNVLKQCSEKGVNNLVIAGDLFDKTLQNYANFEAICRQSDFSEIQIHIIPGNHDPDIRQEHFSARNLKVYSEPSWVEFDPGWSVLFIPYKADTSMGEIIEKHIQNKPAAKWILVGHGDWSTSMRTINPYEPGLYMPLTQRDLAIFDPDFVILGHIHIPVDSAKLFYPGSPCSLDITETGYRRFLVLDTETIRVEPHQIRTDIIYFNERLIILPAEDEIKFMEDQISSSIKNWGLRDGDEERVTLRVKCQGYCKDKTQLLETIRYSYQSFQLQSDPDISSVSIANDPERDYLMKQVGEKIDQLDWKSEIGEPSKNDILLQAMHYVYGGR